MESADALESVSLISGSILDGRLIRVELGISFTFSLSLSLINDKRTDFGFKNGRQFGRGSKGGQVTPGPPSYYTHCAE